MGYQLQPHAKCSEQEGSLVSPHTDAAGSEGMHRARAGLAPWVTPAGSTFPCGPAVVTRCSLASRPCVCLLLPGHTKQFIGSQSTGSLSLWWRLLHCPPRSLGPAVPCPLRLVPETLTGVLAPGPSSAGSPAPPGPTSLLSASVLQCGAVKTI